MAFWRDRGGSDKQRVIVVGARMAGLVAAYDLRDNGCDVTVLEARNRVGGRMFTDRSLGAAIDMDAAWIHGHGRNPLSTVHGAYLAGARLAEQVDDAG